MTGEAPLTDDRKDRDRVPTPLAFHTRWKIQTVAVCNLCGASCLVPVNPAERTFHEEGGCRR